MRSLRLMLRIDNSPGLVVISAPFAAYATRPGRASGAAGLMEATSNRGSDAVAWSWKWDRGPEATKALPETASVMRTIIIDITTTKAPPNRTQETRFISREF